MTSTTNLTTNSRSMNGLNIIEANSINNDNLYVYNLTINLSGTCPNITPYKTNNNKIEVFIDNFLISSLQTTKTILFPNGNLNIFRNSKDCNILKGSISNIGLYVL